MGKSANCNFYIMHRKMNSQKKQISIKMRISSVFYLTLFLILIFGCSNATKGQKNDNNPIIHPEYNLEINVVGNGSVTPESGMYSGFLFLNATPAEGYKFAGWSHDLNGSISNIPLVLGSDKKVTASFVKQNAVMYSISTYVEGKGKVFTNKKRAFKGASVEFTALPDAGYIFAEWKGSASGKSNPLNVIIQDKTELVAVFSKIESNRFYVSVDGSDENNGTYKKPFKTIEKAFNLMNPGDVTYVLPGVYVGENIKLIGRSGVEGNYLHIVAYDMNNKPIIKSGITVKNTSYLHLKSIEITTTQFLTYGIDAHHNVYENIDVHHITNSQVAFNVNTLTHNNYMINCDFHNNVLHSGSNADGIAMWGNNNTTNGPFNNVLLGCRSYFNNDDGFDLWWAGSNNYFENCWAFGNGRDSNFKPIEGDGNGFKLGQGKTASMVVNCLAFKNRNTGFDQNSNTGGGLTIYNCTAFDNTYNNVDFWESPKSSIIRNCISFRGKIYTDAANDEYNSWNMDSAIISADDFVSLDYSKNIGPRNADGCLPKSDFLQLKKGSEMIDAGTDVGLPFSGKAPDLGAYEFNSK